MNPRAHTATQGDTEHTETPDATYVAVRLRSTSQRRTTYPLVWLQRSHSARGPYLTTAMHPADATRATPDQLDSYAADDLAQQAAGNQRPCPIPWTIISSADVVMIHERAQRLEQARQRHNHAHGALRRASRANDDNPKAANRQALNRAHERQRFTQRSAARATNALETALQIADIHHQPPPNNRHH